MTTDRPRFSRYAVITTMSGRCRHDQEEIDAERHDLTGGRADVAPRQPHGDGDDRGQRTGDEPDDHATRVPTTSWLNTSLSGCGRAEPVAL